MAVVTTIIPIFAVILLGAVARQRGMAPRAFLAPANQLVYYLAIPAMIFRSIARASFHTQFDHRVLFITLACVLVGFILAWVAAAATGMARKRRGSFVQSAFHGNLGYIGLAVAFYFLGDEGLVRASIIAGFVMILQNFLAVVALQVHSGSADAGMDLMKIAGRIVGNPVILSAVAGIGFSLAGATLPLVVDRSLRIVSGLALPLALLLIGASLSFTVVRRQGLSVVAVSALKLLLMPGLGLVLFRLSGAIAEDFLPGLILLASPVATLTYVMAGEMDGDQEFAVAAVSASTMLSALTFSLWLHVGSI
jgi:malate permease and related proteins